MGERSVGGGEKSEIGGVKWRVEGSEGVHGKERKEVCDSGGVMERMERGWSSVWCVVEVEG